MDRPFRSKSYSVSAGSTQTIDMRGWGYPATVVAAPGGGGTALVEYSLSPIAAQTPASATWFNWPNGTVAAKSSATLESPVTALRFTATTAAGVFEVIG